MTSLPGSLYRFFVRGAGHKAYRCHGWVPREATEGIWYTERFLRTTLVIQPCGEGNRSGQREKSRYNTGHTTASVNTMGSSGARMALQSSPTLEHHGQAYIPCFSHSVNVDKPKGMWTQVSQLYPAEQPWRAGSWRLWADSSFSSWGSTPFLKNRIWALQNPSNLGMKQ